MKKLFVVDGHALCYRAYYALIRNPLITSEGHNVSAIYGFARMLYRLLKDQSPDYLIMAFDPPVRSFRFDLYSEYKANRSKMPDDLRTQIEEIKRMVELMGVTTIIDEGYEADDVLGSIAHQYASDECEVVLITGDKDAYQLIRDNVYVYANKKGISDHEIYRGPEVKEKLGVDVNQVIDFMAITGDSSDNIPGVKGIGPKGAEKLINSFGSLDGIYENIESVKGKQKELLIEHRDMAYLSKDLVTIKEDVPLNFSLDDALYREITNDKIREFFYELEMDSLVDEFFEAANKPQKEKLPEIEKNYQILGDEKSLKNALEKISQKKEVSIDTETTSVNAMEAELVGISLSIEPGQGWYIPLVNRSLFTDDYLPPAESLKLLIPMIENEKIKKIGQNIKYDAIVFKNNGIDIKGIYFDTLIAAYLLNPSERGHSLDDLAMKHFDYKTITYKELVGTGKNAVPISEVSLEKLAEYAIEDADIAYRLYEKLKVQLKDDDLEKLYYDCEMPLVEVRVEFNKGAGSNSF
jgi:DNA polymerase-1